MHRDQTSLFSKTSGSVVKLKKKSENSSSSDNENTTLPKSVGCSRSSSRVRTRHGTTDWFQIGKGLCRDCILSPCLFNLYAEYIMWNARLDEAQAGIKIARRNTNNLIYADETTLMSESREELKSLLMKVKEEGEKAGFDTQHSENEDHGIWSHHLMGNRWGDSGNIVRLDFWGLRNHCRWWLQPWN